MHPQIACLSTLTAWANTQRSNFRVTTFSHGTRCTVLPLKCDSYVQDPIMKPFQYPFFK